MNAEKPTVLIVAGPNGAGKSTLAPVFLRESLSIRNYVNADTIAKGLSAFASEEQAFRAGRIMLARLRDFATEGLSFAFETTLATRSYAPWLRRLAAGGYHVKVVFLSLRSADLAVARVQARVRAGGHDVAEGVVRRRYIRGVRNFVNLYTPLASQWSVLDNSTTTPPHLLARGSFKSTLYVADQEGWDRFEETTDV